GCQGSHQGYARRLVTLLPLREVGKGLGHRHDYLGARLHVRLGPAHGVVAHGVGAGDHHDLAVYRVDDRADLAYRLVYWKDLHRITHADGATLGGDLVLHEHRGDTCPVERCCRPAGVDRVAVAGIDVRDDR